MSNEISWVMIAGVISMVVIGIVAALFFFGDGLFAVTQFCTESGGDCLCAQSGSGYVRACPAYQIGEQIQGSTWWDNSNPYWQLVRVKVNDAVIFDCDKVCLDNRVSASRGSAAWTADWTLTSCDPYILSLEDVYANNPEVRTLYVIPKEHGCVASGVPAPKDLPVISQLKVLFGRLGDWFTNLLDKLKNVLPFSITGPTEVQPGDTESYYIKLTAPTSIDNDYTDGTFQVRYGNAGLVNKNGDIVMEKGSSRVYDDYELDFQVTIPGNPGEYAIVALITQFDGTYNEATGWSWGEEKVVVKEAYAITSGSPYPVEIPTSSSLQKIIDFFVGIWNWFIGLFS